jgi:hypothetical protein
MTDVFISYRRDDGGWAGRLFDDVGERYDTFFDTDRRSLDYGDAFPAQTMQALDESRVCLAVIGPEWIEPHNLERLADARDWVRRELDAALGATPRIRTVPVLVGGAQLPPSASLPASLRALVDARNAATITHERWSSDVGELVAALGRWLSGGLPPLPARRDASPVRPYLCLCDRVEQQDKMIDDVQEGAGAKRAHVCVVHGHKWELHTSFLDRVRALRVLEDVLDARESGIACVALQWNRGKAKAGRYADVLRRALKGDAMQRPGASDAQLADYLRTLAQPLVAVLQVTWDDYVASPGIVRGMRDAWHELLAEGAGEAKPAWLWINVTYDDDSQALAEDELAGALPRLAPLTAGQIADWLALDRVKPAVAGYEGRVLALADDERYRAPQGRLRMQSFVDEVLRIVPNG